MKDNKLPECCRSSKKGIFTGIISGTFLHIGCFVIIISAILGVTFTNTFFKIFFFNQYYLYIIFITSFVIATFAAFFYIRKSDNKKLRTRWKYLTFLYLSVIIINILIIYIVFPYTPNINSRKEGGKLLKLSFEILCPGHAPLVISELSKVDGIKNVKYISEKSFEVYYDASKINKEKILSEDICKEFNAKEE